MLWCLHGELEGRKPYYTKILNSLRTKCGDDNLLSQFLTCSRDSKKKKCQFSFLFSYFSFPVKSNTDLAFGGLHSLPGFPGLLSKYSSSSGFSHLAKLEHSVLSDLTTIRASCPFLLRVNCPLPFFACKSHRSSKGYYQWPLPPEVTPKPFIQEILRYLCPKKSPTTLTAPFSQSRNMYCSFGTCQAMYQKLRTQM